MVVVLYHWVCLFSSSWDSHSSRRKKTSQITDPDAHYNLSVHPYSTPYGLDTSQETAHTHVSFSFPNESCVLRKRAQPPSLVFSLCVLGSNGFKARGKMFEVKSTSGKLLFSADEQEVVVGAERLRVMGEWAAAAAYICMLVVVPAESIQVKYYACRCL